MKTRKFFEHSNSLVRFASFFVIGLLAMAALFAASFVISFLFEKSPLIGGISLFVIVAASFAAALARIKVK